MVKFKHLILFVTLVIWSGAMAMPPATLDFHFTKFIKARQGLYRQPVRHVCIKDSGADSYAAAVVFSDEIVFLDPGGNETSRDTLPDTLGIKVTESATGEYIYIFGSFQNKPGSYHRLYSYDGKIVFKEETNTPAGTVGLGIPLEGAKEFLMGGFGKIALTTFDGQLVAEKQMLNKDLMEDGDIFVAADNGGGMIFAAVNKFKLPVGQESFNRPILFGFNSRLIEVFEDTTQSLLVTSLKLSQNEKFLLMNEETQTSNLLWILDLAGHKLKSFENPKRIVFSLMSDYLIGLPHNAPAEILSSVDWGLIYAPGLSSPSSWIDAGISDDGTLAVLFDGDQIVLLNIGSKTYSSVDFPFAFQTCSLYGDGRTLILAGEFGFEIYKMVK